MNITGIAFDPIVCKHDTGPGHPERPARFSAVLDDFQHTGLIDSLDRLDVRQASDDDLALVHTRPYIALVKREAEQRRGQLSTGDTIISEASLESARAAAGCVLSSVDAVLSRRVQNAFCLIRPPGHHAGSGRGMGFCLFNNIAVGARYAQHSYGVERVLIADWDVHHGNGTQEIFYRDPSVLFFSTHQSPWYPGTGAADETGAGDAQGLTINCPFPAGSGRAEIVGAFRDRLFPAAAKFAPELVLISAGFDSRIDDPLGRFTLEDRDFAELTKMLLDLAAQTAQGRIVSVLEGGYNLQGLASASHAHVRALLGEPALSPRPSSIGQ
ncbi:MAG: histone deacetylase family protein [Bryobacteraceae bacterium]